MNEYLLYYLKSDTGKIEIANKTLGSVIESLKFSALCNISFCYVDINVQRKRVELLDNVNRIIDLKTNMLKNLDYLVKSQFVDMFTNCINENNEISLSELCEKITDGSHNPPPAVNKSEYMMLSSKNIINNKINFDNPRYITKDDYEKEIKRFKLKENDILLTIVGTIGRTAIVDKDTEDIVLQRSVAIIRPKNFIKPVFLKYQLDNMGSVLNEKAHGVAQKGIYLSDLKDLKIMVPSIELQNSFVGFIEKIDKSKFEIEESIKKLEILKDSLMQEYFG